MWPFFHITCGLSKVIAVQAARIAYRAHYGANAFVITSIGVRTIYRIFCSNHILTCSLVIFPLQRASFLSLISHLWQFKQHRLALLHTGLKEHLPKRVILSHTSLVIGNLNLRWNLPFMFTAFTYHTFSF